jgi:hypothetical protein
MEHNDHLLDLSMYRQQKQRVAEEQVETLYNDSRRFAERETNIREKVRAKMLFMKRFNVNEQLINSERVQQVFREWYLFDYKTIKGDTLFFQYLRAEENNLSESLKIVGALFLTAPWVPVKLKGIDNTTSLEVLDIIQGKVEHVKGNNVQIPHLREDTIFFMRKIPLVLTQWLIGPCFLLGNDKKLLSLQKEYESMNRKNGVLWRAFLKETAPRYILSDL